MKTVQICLATYNGGAFISSFLDSLVNQDLKDFEGTISFMNSADRDSNEIRQHRKERIVRADQYRNENFAETFPILNRMLGVYDE